MKMNQVSFPLFLTYFNNESLPLSDLYILEYIDTQVSNVFRLFINFWHVPSIPLLKTKIHLFYLHYCREQKHFSLSLAPKWDPNITICI